MVANYLVIKVWGEGGQLADLARLNISSLHWGLVAGWPDMLVMAAEGLVEVMQEGEVVGLLQVEMWVCTVEQLEEVEAGEVRRPEVDGETMTCCEEETQATHLSYKRTATAIGCEVNKWLSHLCIMNN